MDPSAVLPSAIAVYQDAHDGRDVPTALAQFTPDAVVTDEGHTYRGTAGVETFCARRRPSSRSPAPWSTPLKRRRTSGW